MNPIVGRAAGLALASILLVGCTGSASSPSSSLDPPDGDGYLLRATITQALPPETRFAWLAPIAITGDGVVLVPGAVDASYPGPLLPVYVGRQISTAGYARIVAEAARLGMLAGNGRFTPDDGAPGAVLGRIEIVVDGVRHELTGDPSRLIVCITTPCEPAPGTPEAFATFWGMLVALPDWLGSELGPESLYRPDGLAILVAPPVRGDEGLPTRLAAWPLDTPLRDLGEPVGDERLPRCVTSRGDDVDRLLAAFGTADQLTNWLDPDSDPSDAVFLLVRPLLPGEDVCAELFGIGA
jgi:hypothetical protein